jgi:hypothetical protein
MFTVPEQYRLTWKVAKRTKYITPLITGMVSDATHKDDGYFFFPRIGMKSGFYFLCKTSVFNGWRYIACIIPSSSIPPTWEELHYLKTFFVEDDNVVIAMPGKGPYLDDNNKGWVYLWHKEDMQMPPIEQRIYGVRKCGFPVWLYRKSMRSYRRSFVNFLVLKAKKNIIRFKKRLNK